MWRLIGVYFDGVFLKILFTGTLIAMSDGMGFGWTSPMIPYFLSNETHISMTRSEAEMLETVDLLGAFAGLPGTILAAKIIGPKKSMILSAFVGCLAWIATLLGQNMPVLYTARFFTGFAGDMCFVAAPMYVAEIADHRIRGFLSSIIYLMMIMGVLTVYITGSFCSYWVPPCIGIILTATQCIIFPFMPESPYYHVYNNRLEQAKSSLIQLRSKETHVENEIKEIQNAIKRQKTEKGRVQDLILIRSNRIAICIMIVLNGVQHFVGISVMIMNLHVILAEAGSIYIKPSLAAITFAAIMLFGAIIAALVMDKFGRKFLLITSSLLTGITLLVMTVFFHLKDLGYDVEFVSWIPAICCMTYAATFKLGLGMVPIVVTAEIFPSTIKSIGMTIADAIYVVMAIFSIQIYSFLFQNYGIHVPFYIFTSCCFLMSVYTFFFIPETKGKTLDEIQLMLKGEKGEKCEVTANDLTLDKKL